MSTETTDPQAQMLPQWRCHKLVRAAKIRLVVEHPPTTESPGSVELQLEGGMATGVTYAWHDRHQPAAGGYFVIYEDGYSSFSPANAFEQGYTRAVEAQ